MKPNHCPDCKERLKPERTVPLHNEEKLLYDVPCCISCIAGLRHGLETNAPWALEKLAEALRKPIGKPSQLRGCAMEFSPT